MEKRLAGWKKLYLSKKGGGGGGGWNYFDQELFVELANLLSDSSKLWHWQRELKLGL